MTNNIEVKDHNSKIIHLIPSDLREPISLVAKIKGFESVDDYVVQLVKEDLESISEGGQELIDIGECIAKYLEKKTTTVVV
jgi:non-homologous end joining protein Ku